MPTALARSSAPAEGTCRAERPIVHQQAATDRVTRRFRLEFPAKTVNETLIEFITTLLTLIRLSWFELEPHIKVQVQLFSQSVINFI